MRIEFWLLSGVGWRFDRTAARTALTYPAISGIDTMIFYDGWTVTVGEKTYEYPGVDPNKAYLVEGRKFFVELVKHDLLVDAGNADLSRLVEELVVARARRGVVASPVNAVEEIALPN